MTKTERYEWCHSRALELRRDEPTISAKAIAARLGVSHQSVHTWLRDAGLNNVRQERGGFDL